MHFCYLTHVYSSFILLIFTGLYTPFLHSKLFHFTNTASLLRSDRAKCEIYTVLCNIYTFIHISFIFQSSYSTCILLCSVNYKQTNIHNAIFIISLRMGMVYICTYIHSIITVCMQIIGLVLGATVCFLA